MTPLKEAFARFKEELDNRDIKIINHLFLYQEEYGTGVTVNKFERLIKKDSRVHMAHQTLINHIKKLTKMGLMKKERDETSKLHFKPEVLVLTDRSWKSLRQIQSSKLKEIIEGFEKITMEGDNISEITENIINVPILSLGRLLKQCILTDDPYIRTILFNVTYDLIKQFFEYAISNAERNDTIKRKILETVESTFKPYTARYEIEL